MKRTLIHIFILLLTAAIAASCSVGMDLEVGKPGLDRQRSILISGQVMDASGNVLEDITIDFNAYSQNEAGGSTVSSETVYTDSKGRFIFLIISGSSFSRNSFLWLALTVSAASLLMK